jgi:hypothetical protein
MVLCKELLLRRARQEYIVAKQKKQIEIAKSKLKAMELIHKYGWMDVFKESLNDAKTQFKSHEEWGRFEFCKH